MADDEGMRILNSIRQLVRALRLFDRETQTRYGVTAAQMFVLHAIEQEEGLSLNALAARTATDQSSASVVVQRLVEAGYVLRTAQPSDRRRIELRLTLKGRNVIRKAPPPAQQKILATVAAMSPRDRKELATLLEEFVGAFGVRGKKAPMLFEDEAAPKRAR
ncbi:MAG TPA: MarR family transcriptional regulator [Thermoanaerobaculia bacterium]|nr:MarR family transcriptional regulator [Thermoanaerobaculia bacterium]